MANEEGFTRVIIMTILLVIAVICFASMEYSGFGENFVENNLIVMRMLLFFTVFTFLIIIIPLALEHPYILFLVYIFLIMVLTAIFTTATLIVVFIGGIISSYIAYAIAIKPEPTETNYQSGRKRFDFVVDKMLILFLALVLLVVAKNRVDSDNFYAIQIILRIVVVACLITILVGIKQRVLQIPCVTTVVLLVVSCAVSVLLLVLISTIDAVIVFICWVVLIFYRIWNAKANVQTNDGDDQVFDKMGEGSSDIVPEKSTNMGEGSSDIVPEKSTNDGDDQVFGKIVVSNDVIAEGSNGTIVFKGTYDGQPCAVKKIVRSLYNEMEREHLRISDWSSHIVRFFGLESNDKFIYLALELCSCNLDDLVQICLNKCEKEEPFVSSIKDQFGISNDTTKFLWKQNGYPTPLLLKLIRDIVSGVNDLHSNVAEIIHRGLCPENILLIKKGGSLCARISGFGSSKSSLCSNDSGVSSLGWSAPEVIRNERQTQAADIFSLGCIIFSLLTKRKHPFGGNPSKRNKSILKSKELFHPLDFCPEACNLVRWLLNIVPNDRPKADEVLKHYFFWDSDTKLQFLCDTSEFMQDSRHKRIILFSKFEKEYNSVSSYEWNQIMDGRLLASPHGGRHSNDGLSLSSLLRTIRNNCHHYMELSGDLQALLGDKPEGYYEYFRSKLPFLGIVVYQFINNQCKQEKSFRKYFKN